MQFQEPIALLRSRGGSDLPRSVAAKAIRELDPGPLVGVPEVGDDPPS
jgi:hypothetical protein